MASDAPAMTEAPGDVRGIVMNGTGGVWTVRTAGGAQHQATMRGRLKQEGADKIAVGDDVRLEEEERGGSWVIAELFPRRSRLARRAPGGSHGERVVVANIDQVIVVFALAMPEPHPRMLDRFLVIAAANDIQARIVFNKRELVSEIPAWLDEYKLAGYPIHFTSVKERIGLHALGEALHGRTSALSGPSGVGKSSLLNSIYPGLNFRVGEISESVNKGRHTTVGAALHPLPDGGFVVDTPGLREIGVWNLLASDLDDCFLEFRPFIGDCKFGDCKHAHEPGCAVRGAVAKGAIGPSRYDSYLKLLGELEEGEKETY
ncbi:MAG: ribosome small subunit-dependent GTPase A [Gemmatimonadaceae bacterium]|nr:ribosome small subunit-dependent GTPase A [Gemmatimonadaceae bacterium]